MKVDTRDAAEEKRILTAMIIDDNVLGRVSARWRTGGLFRVRWANTVGEWAVTHFRRYGKAPRKDVEALFEAWASTTADSATVSLVDRFLASLSDDYEATAEDVNPDYIADMAGEHFNAVQLEQVAEVVKGHVEGGNVAKAMEAMARWNKVEMGVGAGIDVFQDKAAIERAFESHTEPLITYPGAIGEFFGDQFGRDEFVAITGATGRGKTWWLLDLAWMAVRQHRRVAFFEVGDMSQDQIMRRFMCRAAGHPLRPPLTFPVPVAIAREDDAVMATVEMETKSFDAPLNWWRAWEAVQAKARRHKTPLLKLSVHPNSSINVAGIVGILGVWERGGWTPDVVVIDYADILAIPEGYSPGDRDAINETWKQLRNLSQVRHCLVVTATQGDAASYDAHTIRRGNFSDDRRKNDHVTGMLGINATEEEQAIGVFRLNWTKRREEAYTESRCVHVVGCLHLGRPHMRSTF